MFGRLFGKKKSPQTGVEPDPLSPAIKDSIAQVIGTKGIPPMPGAAQKAFQLATNPKADARDFVEVIESDEGLSARILKIANSVYFDRGKKSSTIQEAVVVIGLNELRSLLNATTLAEIFPSRHPSRPQLWENDIATGIIARILAQRFLPNRTDLAFLGGLMHDVGKLLLLQRSSEDYSTVLRAVEQSGAEFCAAETEVYVFNHAEVGQMIGERWNFSPELLAIIGKHHHTWEQLVTTPGVLELPAIIKAADTLAHAFGAGHPKNFTRLKRTYEEQLEALWEVLAIAPAEQRSYLEDLRRSYSLERDLYLGSVTS